MMFIHAIFSWVNECFSFEFMRNALFALLLLSPLFSALGTLVIGNQLTFLSEAIGHSALTGVAIGALLGMQDPSLAMIGFALFLAIATTLIRRVSRVSLDTLIGVLLSFTVALGIVLLSREGGFQKYSRFLIGDILSVTTTDLWHLAIASATCLMVWAFFLNHFILLTLSRSITKSRAISPLVTEMILTSLIALTVALSIPWVGLLVVNSLLILPAATARNLARNTRQFIFISLAVSLISGVCGLLASYAFSTATGATIVLCAMGLFAVSLLKRS